MEKNIKDQQDDTITSVKRSEFPTYIPPKIITYTSEEILEEIGPAQACSPSPCPTFP